MTSNDADADRLGGARAWAARRVLRQLPPEIAALAGDGDYAVGIGPAISGGSIVQAGLGAGLLLHRGGVGWYGNAALGAGLLTGISAGLTITVVRGGVDAFLGVAYAVGIHVAPTLSGVVALFTPQRRFLGASVAVSIGSAFPIEVYVGALRTFGQESIVRF